MCVVVLNKFPLEVGIVFLEHPRKIGKKDGIRTILSIRNLVTSTIRRLFGLPNRRKPRLNFDRYASSYLLLQLNAVQTIFEFNVINVSNINISFPSPNDLVNKDIMDWVDQLCGSIHGSTEILNKIQCWVVITSEELPGKLFSKNRFKWENESKSQMNIALMTTYDWERSLSPPSVFEYIIVGVFKQALLFLSNDFKVRLSNEILGFHASEVTRGCIYDYAGWKRERRFSISTPNLCMGCKDRTKKLENAINIQGQQRLSLYDDVSKVLKMDWMGKPDSRNTPLFNLKKDYRYDIDRNSGLKKNFYEKFRDSIIDNLPQWIVGTIVTGIIGGLLILLGIKK